MIPTTTEFEQFSEVRLRVDLGFVVDPIRESRRHLEALKGRCRPVLD